MLLIGKLKIWAPWEAAGVKLLLTPLDVATKQRLVAETTTYVYDDAGKLTKVDRDVPAYSRAIGRACVLGWDGLIGEAEDGSIVPLPFTPENVDQLMDTTMASDWIIGQVDGVTLNYFKTVDEAGNALAASRAGCAAAAPAG